MMKDDIQLLINRFTELSRRAWGSSCYTYSDFLNLAEQDTLTRLRLDTPYSLEGGWHGAERRLAVFGSEELCGYEASPPITWLELSPVLDRFAENLTHRDYLGSLMGLGIKRETLGDIVQKGHVAYVSCLDTVADYICQQLIQVRRTTVRCAKLDAPPALVAQLPEVSGLVVASERLDAIISAVYHLSRSDSQALIAAGKVFIDGRITENTSFSPSAGAVVSVRGTGRFLYEGAEGKTRKDRLRILIRKYQ